MTPEEFRQPWRKSIAKLAPEGIGYKSNTRKPIECQDPRREPVRLCQSVIRDSFVVNPSGFSWRSKLLERLAKSEHPFDSLFGKHFLFVVIG